MAADRRLRKSEQIELARTGWASEPPFLWKCVRAPPTPFFSFFFCSCARVSTE